MLLLEILLSFSMGGLGPDLLYCRRIVLLEGGKILMSLIVRTLAVVVPILINPFLPLGNRLFFSTIIFSEIPRRFVTNVVVDECPPIPNITKTYSPNTPDARSIVGVELGAVAAIHHGCGRAVWIASKDAKILHAIVGPHSRYMVDDLILGKLGQLFSVAVAVHRKTITTVLLPVVVEVDVAVGLRKVLFDLPCSTVLDDDCSILERSNIVVVRVDIYVTQLNSFLDLVLAVSDTR